MTTDDETFLNRWSRRKQAEPDEIRQEDEKDQAAESPEGDAAPVDPADLPDIDSLEKDSDFTVFMQNGVPEALRNRALRKLWVSDPVLANLDGLNDYDEDFGAILRAGAEEMKKIALEKAEKLKQAAREKIAGQDENQEAVDEDPDTKPAVSSENTGDVASETGDVASETDVAMAAGGDTPEQS